MKEFIEFAKCPECENIGTMEVTRRWNLYICNGIRCRDMKFVATCKRCGESTDLNPGDILAIKPRPKNKVKE